jgi:hypothetical protein
VSPATDTIPLDDGGSSMASTPPLHPSRTRLQNNIIKPKKLFPGMIRFANFCSSSEPESLHEALADANWKLAMDQEYSALINNGTWHLVPAH